MHGADRSSIEYQHIFNDSNESKKMLKMLKSNDPNHNQLKQRLTENFFKNIENYNDSEKTQILKDAFRNVINKRTKILQSIFIAKHNPAMAGYDGYRYPATYSINHADVSRDEYRQKKANMKDLMNPENFKNVIDKGMQQSQQKSINKANIIDKVSHNKLPFELNRMIASYDKLTVSFDVNNSFIKAIERRIEQRGNACNQCAIF